MKSPNLIVYSSANNDFVLTYHTLTDTLWANKNEDTIIDKILYKINYRGFVSGIDLSSVM